MTLYTGLQLLFLFLFRVVGYRPFFLFVVERYSCMCSCHHMQPNHDFKMMQKVKSRAVHDTYLIEFGLYGFSCF